MRLLASQVAHCQCRRPQEVWVPVPGLGRALKEEDRTPLQQSCLENPTDREEPGGATVHRVTEVRHD